MCSIPGLPAPGLEVRLLITRVNLNPSCGLVELWVNMDDERKHIYEQMKQEIQIPKRKFYGSEGKPGDLCLVCISDTWHRARIVSIQSDEYNVFLIDHGEPHIATSEALAWAHNDSSLLPPEIESCILANVIFPENNLQERATKFLKSLPGNTFKGMVQHVLMPEDARKIILDIPNISEYICDVGVPQTIPGEDFKSLVLKSIHLLKGEASEADPTSQENNLKVRCQLEKHDQYLYPELLIDTFETVTVTEVTDPQSIFCQLLIFTKALKILSEQIQQHYREGSEFGEVRPQTCRDPCAARDVTGRWHRSLLKQSIMTGDVAVEVLHVDEGKTELVPVRDIRPLHGKFLRMPVVTYVCSLNGLNSDGTEWTPDQVEYLKSLILNQTLMAKFNHHDISQDVYRVTLYTANAECINSCFLEKAGLFPAPKDEDENVCLPLSSLGDEQDLKNTVNVNVDDLLHKTLPSDKNLNSSSSLADVSTTSTDDPVYLEHSDNSEHDFDVGVKSNVNGTCGGVTSDEEGLLLNMVDIETPAHSVCQLLAKECAQTEAHIQTPPQVPLDAYNYSTHNIEVGGKANVRVTSSESVGHFYCQLVRNSHLLDKVMEDIKQLTVQPQCTDQPLGLSSICFVRHHDDQWHRGQIVEMSPKLKVNFVDYGETVAVDKSDICPFPSEGGLARSVPVLAVPLGLFDVPAEVPQEVNQWFANTATDQSLAISVISKGDKGKLLVELFDGALNVNVLVRERISKMAQQNMTGFIQQTDQLSSKSSEQSCVPNEYCSKPAPMNGSVLTKTTEQNSDHSGSEMCPRDEVKMNSESFSNVSATETEYEKTFDVIVVENKFVMARTLIEGNHSNSEIAQISLSPCLEESFNICMYKEPKIFDEQTEEVYASCVVGPHFFWCQYANTEYLNKLSILAQEAGQAQQDTVSPETLGPGSPCLAFFPSDNRWYRAQVIKRTDNSLHVVFIDYGNESDIEIKNVRPLPQILLDVAPQAFLCSLNGFDESKGSWDDQVYDDFYNLLVDKPLRMTVFNMEDHHSEMDFPKYSVQIECEKLVVNNTMQKYWKPVAEEPIMTESPQTKDSLQVRETESDQTELHDSEEKTTSCLYKKPEICKNQAENVYASFMVDPCFFWCQYTKTEDLNKLSILAQEAGQAQQDTVSPETPGPGSPCLAFFPSDNRWYRAQVIHRTDSSLHVVFIDYGNETDIEIKNVRPLPQILLDVAPQAFLCSLNGFDESKGSWDDQVYDDFYNLLVDKPLRVTVVNMEDHSEMDFPLYSVQIECEKLVVNNTMQKYWKPVAEEPIMTESPQTKDSLQVRETESDQTELHDSEEKTTSCMYKKPEICKNQAENVYASCMAAPFFFWCQYTKTEDLNKLSILAQEAGQAQQDTVSPETLGPGSPCLAFFSSDNQWYRAQVIHRTDSSLHVVFIDYGNETDIEIKNVRPLPQILLDVAPQAFLCSLNGFDESKGSWDDQVYDDFYNLLVDKPLRVMVLNMEDHSEMDFPKYSVQIECENVVVNDTMLKYWKPVAMEQVITESPQTKDSLQVRETESDQIQLHDSEEKPDTCMYKKPEICINQAENVYASCMAAPFFFWCQYTKTEDLNKLSILAQEAGQSQQDTVFLETPGTGSPCLAFFPSDNQWYRAQVIHRTDSSLHVVFIDYGNESDIEIKNVRPLPQILLDVAPQAFLCSLNGFDESKGSWDDQVYDDFYNLLVDKPLRVTALNMEDHSEMDFPQYAVELECEGVVVNEVMEKYWKGLQPDPALAEGFESVHQDENKPTNEVV